MQQCGHHDGGVQAGDKGALRILKRRRQEERQVSRLVQGGSEVRPLEAEDQGGERPEDRDAEGVADLVAGLRDRAGRTRTLRGDCADGGVGDHAEGDAVADSSDHGRGDVPADATGDGGGQEQKQAAGDGEVADDERASLADTVDEGGGEDAGEGEDRCSGEREQCRVQDAQVQDGLKVDAGQVGRRRPCRQRQQPGDDRDREGAVTEQGEVDQRVLEMPLAEREERQDRKAEQPGHGRQDHKAVCGQVLDAVDREQQAPGGGHDAEQVDAAGPGRPDLAQQDRREHEEDGDDGQVDQEDRAPPELSEQRASDDRADGEPGRERGGEDSDRPGTLLRVGEQFAEHRERRGQQGRACHAHEGPAGDEKLRGRRERRPGGSDTEHGRADHQQLQAAVAVTDATEGDQQGTDGEAIDVQHPQRLVGGGRDGLGDARHRQEQD